MINIMKNNTKPKLHISLSKEHNKYQSDVADAFKGLDVSFDGGLMRFSSEELAMQIMLAIGTGVVSSAMWDVIKAGIKKLYKKFNTSRVTLRDSDSIMYTIKQDFSVIVSVVPDRAKEFEKSNQKNDADWQLVPVSDVFTFVKSYAFSRDNLTNGVLVGDKIGNIHYGDIHATYTSENIDLSKIQIPIVKEVGFNPKKEDLLKDGDLIMADASEDYDGIGVTISVHGIGKNKVVGGLHTFVLRDEKGKTSEYYRQYIFLNREIRNKLQKVANGVSVYGISKTALSKMELSLPSLSEQNRIVSVLDTWDKSIEKLERKIETKKQIKKALMQDLLTGKKRLSGFNEKWKLIKLGDIATFKKGKGLPKSEIDSNGKYEAIHYGELFTKYSEYIETVISKTNSNENMFLSKRNDILMPTSDVTPRGLSTASYIDKDGVVLGGDILVIRSSGSLNGLFFCYIVNLNKKDVIKLVSGSTVFHLYGSDMAKFELKLPPLKEQESIVKILVTADKEITELEKKLSIIKEQKRYLLNNLITGTIRTPETLSTKLTK